MLKSKKHFLAIVGVSVGLAILGMIFSMVNTALSAVQHQFSASLLSLQWVMNIFGIVTCSTLVTFGRLADIYGRKKIFILGLVAAAIGLTGAGLSNNMTSIIVFMGITGFANAIILPVSQALLSNMYEEKERSKAMGIWGSVAGLSLAVGPLVSGIVIHLMSWRAVFLTPLLLVATSFFLVLFFVEESVNQKDHPSVDKLGTFFLVVMLASFVMAIVQIHTWPALWLMILFLLSTVSFIALLYVEKKALAPIIREDLFSNRRFVLASITMACIIFYFWAIFFMMPLFLQSYAGLSSFLTGLILAFVTIPLGIFSPLITKLYKNIEAKFLIASGFVLLVLSTVVQMTFQPTSSIALFIVAMFLFGFAMVLIWGPSITVALSTLTKDRAGIASGTFVTIQEIGGALGLAITVTVMRSHSVFMTGFRSGELVLLGVCLIGFFSAIALNKNLYTMPV